MASGCSVRSGPYSPDITCCRTRPWRSSWPTAVSRSPNYCTSNSSNSCSSSGPRRDTSFLSSRRSVSHVQPPRPGDGEEGDLQSSSCGSGHQLRPSTGQVGHEVLAPLRVCHFLTAVVSFCAFEDAGGSQPLS